MSLTVNNLDSNSMNTLLAGLNTSGSTGIESLLSDYSSIKSGSYGKLMGSYFSKVDTSSATKKKTADKESSELNEIKTDSEELAKACDTFLTKGTGSIWKEKAVTDENGNTTKEFNKDSILSSLESFISSYNGLVSVGEESKNSSISNTVSDMISNTASYKSSLQKLGISIDKNNKLSIDKDYFKNNADMNTAKSLFAGNGSYVYSVKVKASMTASYAKSAISTAKGNKNYTSTGDYSISSSDIVSSLDTKL